MSMILQSSEHFYLLTFLQNQKVPGCLISLCREPISHLNIVFTIFCIFLVLLLSGFVEITSTICCILNVNLYSSRVTVISNLVSVLCCFLLISMAFQVLLNLELTIEKTVCYYFFLASSIVVSLRLFFCFCKFLYIGIDFILTNNFNIFIQH